MKNFTKISSQPLTRKLFLISFVLGFILSQLTLPTFAVASTTGEFCGNNNVVSSIDKFNTKAFKITSFYPAPKNFDTVLSASALGGELDVFHNSEGTSANTDITMLFNQNFFSFSNGAQTKGKVLLVWDGIDNSQTINYTGLDSVNLSQNNRRDALNFVYFSDFVDNKPVVLTFTIYTNSSKASKLTVPLYGEFATILNKTIKLSDFTASVGARSRLHQCRSHNFRNRCDFQRSPRLWDR